eukprot:COSAG05_NODE_6298_length_984_cov_0.772009_1_plen_34_part_10
MLNAKMGANKMMRKGWGRRENQLKQQIFELETVN